MTKEGAVGEGTRAKTERGCHLGETATQLIHCLNPCVNSQPSPVGGTACGARCCRVWGFRMILRAYLHTARSWEGVVCWCAWGGG